MTPASRPDVSSINRINYLNVVLMLLSMLLSWYRPFEVFTLSLILIGPLHYFTEISWLDKRNYFAFSRSQFWLFIPVSFFITIGGLNRASPINQYAVSLLFGCFVYAFFSIREPNLLKNLIVEFQEKSGQICLGHWEEV